MANDIQQMTRILEVLRLKRQSAEKALAALQLHDRALLGQLRALAAPPFQTPLDDDALGFAMAAPAYALWQENKRSALREQRAQLSEAIITAQNALRILIVQIDNVERRYNAARGLAARAFQAHQSEQTQEIWQAVHKL